MFVDSIRPWDRPVFSVASIVGLVRCDLALEVHERRDSRAARPDRPSIEGRLPFFAFDGEDISQPFFEQVGAP